VRTLGDTKRVPDEVVDEYLLAPEVGLRESQYRHKDVEEAHKVGELSTKVNALAREFRTFNPRGMSMDNLSKLRHGIDDLLQAGQDLEVKISDALRKGDR